MDKKNLHELWEGAKRIHAYSKKYISKEVWLCSFSRRVSCRGSSEMAGWSMATRSKDYGETC
ncbi:hypothetical protein CRYUN_Cryun41cG0044600 [Craigia yunnanensis]